MKKTAALTAIRESSVEELKGRLKRLEEELFQHRLKRGARFGRTPLRCRGIGLPVIPR